MSESRPAHATRILVTGGTFDKHYDAIKGELTFKESHLPAILAQSRVTTQAAIEVIQLIDSLHMTDAHRRQVLEALPRRTRTCADRGARHGYDARNGPRGRRSGFGQVDCFHRGRWCRSRSKDRDALFNLGFAFAAAQLLPDGTYVAMNARVFGWEDVEKNRAEGVFVQPNPEPATWAR